VLQHELPVRPYTVPTIRSCATYDALRSPRVVTACPVAVAVT